jgi:hypothetical protein
MKIQDLFERDIYRSINGVVKADQLDASSVWQELDEFVITRELTTHITDLVAVLLETIESEKDAAGKNGVWVSGFFGCGKSHFIKVLSYLLENQEHSLDGEHRRAVDFFSDKITDPMLYADLKKVVGATTDTILFNIDSKADHRSGRDALLQVFLKVLNEKQGYSGDHPHIAHMERHLDEKGKLEAFKSAFQSAAGESWLEQRDAWEFHRDEVVTALQEALGQSESSVEKWVDSAEDHFSLTVENFAKWVKRYLDKKGKGHRIMFLVDEVGQFIGNDTHMMLNLQTITEQLGTICNGRAWVVVTSQEDLDAVLGDLRSSQKKHDFSKIQGRFKTRLSLSSGNVDEVIKERLLRKNETASAPLAAAYDGKHDILKNQLSFTNAGMTFNTYANTDDFAAGYPFAAYQFTLVQKVFESIRKAGATGLHLSQGERSTLDAFQSAAKQLGQDEIGALVPFYRFYPSVEGFLDTAVKRTIDQANDNHALKSFDTTVLKVLFLIRYIEELPGNVDNLVTLCVNEIDTDKLALRKIIEESLARLESETLIARNGDLYFFLTNEERDIGREIKDQKIPSGAEERELGKFIFEEILDDSRKHTYSLTGRDFNFTRLCDDHPVGSKLDGSLEVAFVSPLGENYDKFSSDEFCCLHTGSEPGRVLIRLPLDLLLGRELQTYLQTASYVKTKPTATLPDTAKRILRDRSDDNRARRSRILTSLESTLADACYFVSGKKLEIGSTNPKVALSEALEYLIQNAYPKMGDIQHLHSNALQEIQSTLRANDVEQVNLTIETPEANTKALDDLRDYIRLSAIANKQIVLRELIDKRYGGRPYGWPEQEVVLLVARLAVLKEINLLVNSAPLAMEQAYDHLTSNTKQRKVIITQRESADGDVIKKAQALGKELFAQQGPSSEDGLFNFLKDQVGAWDSSLAAYEPLAKTGNYPGIKEIQTARDDLRQFVDETDSLRFLKRFIGHKNELLDLSEDIHELQDFYINQKHSWEALRTAVGELSQNRLQLEADTTIAPALARMEEIQATARPYKLLHEVAALIHTARTANDQLVSDARGPALLTIQSFLDYIRTELDNVSADADLRTTACNELSKLLEAATKATSIAHIAQAQQTAEDAYDRALTLIEKAQTPPPAPKPTPGPTPPDTVEDPKLPTPQKPLVKKRRVIEVKSLCSSNFIETNEDLETFLSKLRTELTAALDADERVQIK